MKFYLTVINPAIAVIILLLCTWAAIYGEMSSDAPGVNFIGIIQGDLTSYFFAKGLFCSSALFISGRTLLALLQRSIPGKTVALNG